MPPKGGRKHPQQEFLQVDTTNILFICGGAFVGLERDHRAAHRPEAASASAPTSRRKKERKLGELLAARSQPEDLLKFGMIPEFIGRLPVIATLHELDEDALDRHPHQAEERAGEAVPEAVRDGRREAEVHQGRAARRSPARRCARKRGARGLRAILENAMLDIMYDTPGAAASTK